MTTNVLVFIFFLHSPILHNQRNILIHDSQEFVDVMRELRSQTNGGRYDKGMVACGLAEAKMQSHN